MPHKPRRKWHTDNDMAPTLSQIGYWLALARRAKGIKQREAGAVRDTDGGTVSRWENGRQPMGLDTFLALCDLYGVEVINLRDIARIVVPEKDTDQDDEGGEGAKTKERSPIRPAPVSKFKKLPGPTEKRKAK